MSTIIIPKAFSQINPREYHEAALTLQKYLDPLSGTKLSTKVELMRWVANCFSKSGDSLKAAHWFEMAAKSTLGCRGIYYLEHKTNALADVELAISCYMKGNDPERVKRLSKMRDSMARAKTP